MTVPEYSKDNLTRQFITLLTKLNEFETIPHHFDETLVDKLLEEISFSDPMMTQILHDQLVQHNIFEQTSAYSAVFLRLMTKAINTKAICLHEKPFSTFFHELPTFLYQSRPPFVIGRVFDLCLAALPFVDDLNDVLTWAVSNFSDSLSSYDAGSYKMTVFVRTRIEELLKSMTLSEQLAQHLLILSEIFRHCPILDSPFVLNSIARIAKVHTNFFETQWNPDSILRNLLRSNPTGRGLAPEIFEYICEKLPLTDNTHNLLHNYPLFAINFWLFYFYRHSKIPEAAVDLVVNNSSLEQFCSFIAYFYEQNKLEEAIEKIRPHLTNRKKVNASSLLKFLEKLLPVANESQILKILETCHEAIANAPPILRLLKIHEVEYVKKCPVLREAVTKKVKDVFIPDIMNHEWETIECALEVAECVPFCLEIVEIDDNLLFHENDYVALAALRCAITKNPKTFNLYSRIITQSVHSQSKLLALKLLRDNYPESQDQCLKVLLDALEDDDNENRWAAFQIGKLLFSNNIGHEILKNYADDYLIGVEVRRLFGLDSPTISSPILHALEDIISALEMINVDVPDCS